MNQTLASSKSLKRMPIDFQMQHFQFQEKRTDISLPWRYIISYIAW
jgi:hypothetical protein